MKVEVEISKKDIVALNFLLWTKIRSNWILFGVASLICFIIALAQISPTGIDLLMVGLCLLVGATFGAVGSIVAFMLSLVIAFSSASERTGLGAHTYEIIDQGLSEKTPLNEEITNWAAFQNLWKFPSYIVLQKSWAAAHVFPARCFSSPKEFDAFHEELKSRLNRY